MDDEADQTADQGAVDADILEVAADRAFEPVRYGARVPAADRVRNQRDDAVAIGGDDPDRGAPGELIDRGLEARLLLERLAELAEGVAELAGHGGVWVAGALEQAG